MLVTDYDSSSDVRGSCSSEAGCLIHLTDEELPLRHSSQSRQYTERMERARHPSRNQVRVHGSSFQCLLKKHWIETATDASGISRLKLATEANKAAGETYPRGSLPSVVETQSPSSSLLEEKAADAECCTVTGQQAHAVSGWLNKRGFGFPYRWQSRYCTFDCSRRTLSYYETKGDVFDVRGQTATIVTVVVAPRSPRTGIIFVDSRGLEFVAEAASHEEQQSWIEIVEAELQKPHLTHAPLKPSLEPKLRMKAVPTETADSSHTQNGIGNRRDVFDEGKHFMNEEDIDEHEWWSRTALETSITPHVPTLMYDEEMDFPDEEDVDEHAWWSAQTLQSDERDLVCRILCDVALKD